MVVLEFTPTNWMVPQYVWVGAINDPLQDGTRNYEVSSSVLSADSNYENAVVRNVDVTKSDTGQPGIQLANLGNSNTVGIYSDGIASGNTLSSASADFVSTDLGQSVYSLNLTAGSATLLGTIMSVSTDGTIATLSSSVPSLSNVVFSLPSRVATPATFTDGSGTGTTTFTSQTAHFTLSDVGQPVLETDGLANIPTGTVIIGVTDSHTVTLSNTVANASGIGFELPSRLAGYASFRDGSIIGNQLTSDTAAFNTGDLGRPIFETDGRGLIASAAVIVGISTDGTVATLSSTLGNGQNVDFALPARNASNVIVEGNTTPGAPITGVVDYFTVALTAAPTTGTVVVDLTPNDGYVVLSGPGVTTKTPATGTAAGVWQVSFNSTDWQTPVVVTASVNNLNFNFDPHNTFITTSVDATVGNYPASINTDNSPLVLQAINNEEAGSVVQAPSGMVVTKCADTACTTPGPGSSYSMRLTTQPSAPVTVALIGDGQTYIPITPGGRISLQPIGAPGSVTMFTGNVTIAGNTITLAAGQLSSFVTEGFQAGQIIDVSGTGVSGVDNGPTTPYTIASVTASQITLAQTLTGSFGGCATGNSCVTIGQVVNQGLYTGNVSINACATSVMVGSTKTCTSATITRTDGSSWLDDGFLEGQLFQLNGAGPLFKVQALTGTTQNEVNILTITNADFSTAGAESATALNDIATVASGVVTFREWAPELTFNANNWYVPVSIPVLADPYYSDAANANLLEFPKTPHLLSNIEGPLSVEGGPTGDVNAALHAAVMLPREKNSPAFGVGVQPPEAQQVNVLNIFDDGSEQDQTGTLSSTTLSGFGMGLGLDFSTDAAYTSGKPTFGEPAVFPSGISFGSITLTPPAPGCTSPVLCQGTISNPSASLSSVQVLNLMMGQGNDHLTVTGSLVPGPFVNDNGSACTNTDGTPCTFIQGGLTVVQGGGALPLTVNKGSFAVGGGSGTYTITRLDQAKWADSEFAMGQELMWNGTPFGVITAVSGDQITVAGSLPNSDVGADVQATIAVFGPTVTSTASFTLNPTSDTITRNDLLSWAQFGFRVGQTITVDGVIVGTVKSLGAAPNNVMTITPCTGCTLPGTGGTVAVFGPSTLSTGSFTFSQSAGTITRGDQNSWAALGFAVGETVMVNGTDVGRVTAISGATGGVLTIAGTLPASGSTCRGRSGKPGRDRR